MSKTSTPFVLVVDDEPPLVELVCEGLEEAGIHAMSCTKSDEAYSRIQSHHPALVILDVQMPEVDGLKIFRQMRADPATRSTPVIFLTGNVTKLQRWLPNYESLGAQLLPKPFDIDTLLHLVQKSLGKAASQPIT